MQRATQKSREEFVGLIVGHASGPSGIGSQDERARISAAQRLLRYGATLGRIAERQCNGYQTWDYKWDEKAAARDEAKEERIVAKVKELCESIGCKAILFAVTGLLFYFVFHRAWSSNRTSVGPSHQEALLADVSLLQGGIEVLENYQKLCPAVVCLHRLQVVGGDIFFGKAGTPVTSVIGRNNKSFVFISSFMDWSKHILQYCRLMGVQPHLATSEYADGRRFPVVGVIKAPTEWHSQFELRNLIFESPHVRTLVFDKIILHVRDASMGFDGVPDDSDDPHDFNKPHPPWRILVAACLGIIALGWGWYNIRSNRRLFWGTCSFLFGVILWGYEAYSFLEWSAKP